tara:strand:- start:736 stop:1188 length:453 start_codon:yes stop_codon:yes gene_type:complete
MEISMAKAKRKITRTGALPTKKEKTVTFAGDAEKKIEKEKQREKDVALGAELSKIKQYTVTPAGRPPHDLEGDDMESITDWVTKLKTTRRINHTVQSCQFWVKYFFCPFDQKEQWNAVRAKIKDNHEILGLPNFQRQKYTGPTEIENQGW